MAKLALNKSALNREGKRLQTFHQFLPALDLKRKQLLAARVEARHRLDQHKTALQALHARVGQELAMLAESDLPLESLLSVKSLSVTERNLVGVVLPELQQLELENAAYSHLLLPHWVDPLLNLQAEALRLEVEIQLGTLCLQRLEDALQKTTQRLNLFDKVLIPKTEKNIRRIRIALSDAERAGVVRAKIAKNKHRSLA
ncbi:V-type ATP synthase subunit D [Neptuniibacter sp. CAU 1671]|uniref:V-type ATP synthase subunit D n=1 Tax=Neptuniibacter sp. CAU 1671 TaxID=3032593 RepID=UPI0023DA916A|nr:V-type ATP synthase subunit D [Neptuniibacter sp. CAU 1671]MDF2181268.1 V-type ATP synthase subunit D [Neptuniibacter sp. CAU 1671]